MTPLVMGDVMKFYPALLFGLLAWAPSALADPRALYEQATAAFQQHDFAKTVALTGDALGEMDGNDPLRGGVLHIRAAAEMMLRKYDDAIADYSAALDAVRLLMAVKPELHKLVLGILWERGLAKTLDGHCPDAILDYNQVLADDATNARTLADRGRCYADLGQKDAARADFDAALRIDPDSQDALKWRSEL
jgi:tetratricopeptide (TPR) repeat protein